MSPRRTARPASGSGRSRLLPLRCNRWRMCPAGRRGGDPRRGRTGWHWRRTTSGIPCARGRGPPAGRRPERQGRERGSSPGGYAGITAEARDTELPVGPLVIGPQLLVGEGPIVEHPLFAPPREVRWQQTRPMGRGRTPSRRRRRCSSRRRRRTGSGRWGSRRPPDGRSVRRTNVRTERAPIRRRCRGRRSGRARAPVRGRRRGKPASARRSAATPPEAPAPMTRTSAGSLRAATRLRWG